MLFKQARLCFVILQSLSPPGVPGGKGKPLTPVETMILFLLILFVFFSGRVEAEAVRGPDWRLCEVSILQELLLWVPP